MPVDVQKEHGHSPIAHPIMEALALAPFSASHLKVLLHVIRQTYGWSRKDSAISHGELSAATGLHKDTVRGAAAELVREGVLVQVGPATFTGPAVYRLQKDPREWGRFATTVPSLTQCDPAHTPRAETTRGGGLQSHRGGGLQSHPPTIQVVGGDEPATPLKQGKAKENKQADADAPAATVFEHWRETSGHTTARFTKERKRKISARLGSYSADQLCAAIDRACSNPFYRGDNDRGQRYDWIETILKNDDAVDRHLAYEGKTTNGSRPNPTHKTQAELLRDA